MTAVRVDRVSRRRGAFGLDERRRPDPARVEDSLRRFIAGRLPEVWPLPADAGLGQDGERATSTRILALLLPHGHVAVLLIERDPDHPAAASRALAERCDALRIPYAMISNLDEGRAALRRFGVEPRPMPPTRGPTPHSVFARF